MSSQYDSEVAIIKNSLDNIYLKHNDVVDNLNSTSTTNPLSANQGKQLKDLIGNSIEYINR